MVSTPSRAGFWNNSDESLGLLNPLLGLEAPSKEALVQLSAIEPYDNHQPGDPQIASSFLKAASKHIGLVGHPPEDQTMITRMIESVAEISGKAATLCLSRSSISKSGILLALLRTHDGSLSSVAVEFLQCALLAGQYRFAERALGEDWPRPGNGVSVELVSRYYYLRGLVHIGCDHFQLAVRCFWTVLSIPSETASAIAVDAWKKMILVKSIVVRDSLACQLILTLPVGAPNALSRFLTGTSPGTDPESILSEIDSTGISRYIEMVKASHACNRKKFTEMKKAYLSLFDCDRNLGLVERLETDLEHRSVHQLALVYRSLPLAQIAIELECTNEHALCTLRQVDGIHFSHKNGMIWFEIPASCPVGAEDARSFIKLSETIRKLDASVANSSRYQSIENESRRQLRGVDDF